MGCGGRGAWREVPGGGGRDAYRWPRPVRLTVLPGLTNSDLFLVNDGLVSSEGLRQDGYR